MANDFSGDTNCKALYRIENAGVLGADSIGGNTLTNLNITQNTAAYKEGVASAELAGAEDTRFSRLDANLDAGFPLKNGDTTKKISMCFWMKPSQLPVFSSEAGLTYIVGKYSTISERSLIAILRTAGGYSYVGWQGGYEEGDTPFGYWNTDDVGGNSFKSSAELVGFTVDTVNMKEGTACLDFDGTNDYCMLADGDLDAGFPLKTGDAIKKISVCFWCKPAIMPASGDYDVIISKSNPEANKRSFSVMLYNNAGTLTFTLALGHTGGTASQLVNHPGTPQTGRWYFVCASYDDSDKSYRFRIWDDTAGALLGGAEVSGTAANNIAVTNADWRFASQTGGFPSYYSGQLDYVSVFKDILAAAEMDDVRTGSKDPAEDENCAAFWRCDLGHANKNCQLAINQWYHVGLTYDDNTRSWRLRVYDVTAAAVTEATGTASHNINIGTAAFVAGDQGDLTSIYAPYKGLLDEIAIFNDILTADEIDDIRSGLYGASAKAISPSPGDLSNYLETTVSLSWQNGGRAATYDVYWGTSAESLVLVSASQAGTIYDVPGDLVVNQRYYWRIDSINDYGTTTGDVWSFLVLSYAPLMGRWTWPVRERLIFNTEILQSHDRTEQRIAKRRGVTAQQYATQLLLERDDGSAEFEAMIHGWLKNIWTVPIWPEAEKHVGTLPAGSGSVAIDTRYADFRDGSYAVIWQDKDNNEVIITSAVSDNLLTFSSPTAHAYEGTKWIMPCRIGRVIEAGAMRRVHGGALVDIAWRIEDVAAVTGFAAGMSYDGYTVLTDPAVLISGAGQFSHDPDVAVLESGSGPFEIISNSSFNEVIQSHGWRGRTKADAWWLRQFLYNIKGRQKAFLVPTFHFDLTLTHLVNPADTDIYVQNAALAQNMGLNTLRTYLAFRPAGSDIIPRKITGVALISAAEEKITINTAPGVSFSPGDHLCWLDRCRLASDEIELTYSGVGECEAATPLIRVVN